MATVTRRAASPLPSSLAPVLPLCLPAASHRCCHHRFQTYYRTRAVRRHYFETLHATTDVLSSIADPLDFPEDAFAPLASLISEATEWAGNRLAAAC